MVRTLLITPTKVRNGQARCRRPSTRGVDDQALDSAATRDAPRPATAMRAVTHKAAMLNGPTFVVDHLRDDSLREPSSLSLEEEWQTGEGADYHSE
jgi:hypothetical protein